IIMKRRVAGFLAGLVLAAGTPVVAHHSFAAEYDGSKPVKVSGVVTKVEWTNPHIWFYVDVKDDQGHTETARAARRRRDDVRFETDGPVQARRRGLVL